MAATLTISTASALASPAPGDLDPSFAHHGKMRTTFDPSVIDAARSAAIGNEGRIVAAGEQPFSVARYRPNGKLDQSFSRNGKVTTNFGSKNSGAIAVAITGRGKVVAVGSATGRKHHRRSQTRLAIVRYKPNGHLDRSFSDDGKVLVNFNSPSAAVAAAIDSKGRIVVVGETRRDRVDHGIIVRLKKNGALDQSFSGTGVLDTGQGGLRSLAIDSQDRIVVGVGTELQRYMTNGHLDPSFGAGGAAPLSLFAFSLALDSRDRIIATGEPSCCGDRFVIQRLTPNGQPDPSFGSDGTATTGFNGSSSANSVAIDSKKRIVAFGLFIKGGERRFATARFLPNGAPDLSFGHHGKVTTRFGGPQSLVTASAVAIDAHDRIVGAGGARHGFALVRYLG